MQQVAWNIAYSMQGTCTLNTKQQNGIHNANDNLAYSMQGKVAYSMQYDLSIHNAKYMAYANAMDNIACKQHAINLVQWT